MVFEIKQGNGRFEDGIDPVQALQDDAGIQLIDERRGHIRNLIRHFLQFMVRKAGGAPLRLEELAVQSGEQPAFHLPWIVKLVPFTRPQPKRLLGQVAGVAFFSRQTQGKPIKSGIITVHQDLEIQFGSHVMALNVGMSHETATLFRKKAPCASSFY